LFQTPKWWRRERPKPTCGRLHEISLPKACRQPSTRVDCAVIEVTKTVIPSAGQDMSAGAKISSSLTRGNG
jgi:hypothetical protein